MLVARALAAVAARLEPTEAAGHYAQTMTQTTKPDNLGVLAEGLACPPCNVGPLSMPDYPALAAAAVHKLPDGEVLFAGQRAEGFYVDLGAIFDLGVEGDFFWFHCPDVYIH